MGKAASTPPRPFLKWAGGKRQLLPAILARMPQRMGTFYEPFVGGGAVFLALASRRPRPFRRAVLADRNRELIGLWRSIQEEVEAVVEALGELASRPADAGTYYEIRDLDAGGLGSPERAARLLYLNRTCYNGLYRVNRQGRFNVPYGRYRQPRILDAANLRAVSRTLQGVRVEGADFEEVVRRARPGSVVYFDPPYYPVSATARFTAYDSQPFGPEEQARLARVFRRLARSRVYALLSNSRVPETEELYRGLPRDVVPARRAINSRADRRGPVQELLVRTAGQVPGAEGTRAGAAKGKRATG
jgi:DNA adenine methylase